MKLSNKSRREIINNGVEKKIVSVMMLLLRHYQKILVNFFPQKYYFRGSKANYNCARYHRNMRLKEEDRKRVTLVDLSLMNAVSNIDKISLY